MKLSLRDIEWAVCAKFHMTPDQIRCLNRKRRFVRPRQIAMFLAREMTDMSYVKLGIYFCRDHTTVIDGVRRIRTVMEEKPKVRGYVEELRASLSRQREAA